MMSQAREVELRLADNFVITPRVTGAIKALPGVLACRRIIAHARSKRASQTLKFYQVKLALN